MGICDPNRLHTLHERWNCASARERSNAQLYIVELCDALGVERPRPAGTGYEFEHPVHVVGRDDGVESCNFIDLYKRGCFVLEAKQQGRERVNDIALRRAFGQAHTYAKSLPGSPPPYLLVLDVGRTLLVWDRWQGTYGSFAGGRRIDLSDLAHREDDIRLLQDIWEEPSRRNPGVRAAEVTEEIAGRLAELARRMEDRGYAPERVARFMMRCVFTMFAEDTGLLPERFFQRAVHVGVHDPSGFVSNVEELWRAMDQGRRFYFQQLLRFNGHFFRDAEALPLLADDLALLLRASQAAWRQVEPAIFGTLLVRALDPAERHRLGAEYTPRAYVERVVRATMEEPVREWWTCVQAEVLELRDCTGKSEQQQRRDTRLAIKRVREFHDRLRSLRVLDPACGSGNFLYVALHTLKRIEREVLLTIEQLTGQHDLGVQSVGPWQFHGIEVKPWAREIAELTLWIGYHQVWTEYHPGTHPPEPVLRATGTLDHRDALLGWETIEEDVSRGRPDPTPRIPHAVTGRLVPDPAARLHYQRYWGAHRTEWPQADFIIGNPPYMGQARQREAFGDGYVDALRDVYPGVPDSADYVMYWWHRAAEEVASGRAVRAGMITTNSVAQAQNRAVIEAAAQQNVRITWAVADHPWVDESGAASVRVAMTVVAKDPATATLVQVDEQARPCGETVVDRLNFDLTAHADVATASSLPLRANAGLASPGFKLHGNGFILPPEEGASLREFDARSQAVVKRYLNGRDVAARPRGVYIVDFGLRTELEAKEHPVLYDIVRSRVKPERDANNDRSTRVKWWRFGRNREELRSALADLPRYIATPETAKHRVFVFLDADVAPDNTLVCIASADAFHLGVLSSAAHAVWALAAGSRLGIGNDPRYNKTRCFDSFPFPDPEPGLRTKIAELAERLNRHRWEALARDRTMTLTGIYNVVEKLRAGAALSPADRRVHDRAACGVLLDLHNELDEAVAAGYGWAWPMATSDVLQHLVSLHHERRMEEETESVRWLRPDLQASGSLFGIPASTAVSPPVPADDAGPLPWPSVTVEQIAALLGIFVTGALSVEIAAGWFDSPDPALIERHLNTLVLMGEVQRGQDDLYRRGDALIGSSSTPARRPHPVQPPWSMMTSRRTAANRRSTTANR